MSEIMSHDQWMSLTHGGLTSVRGSELKAVDSALKKYHATQSASDKEALSGALLKWMQSKGSGWRTSVRNRHHAVEALYGQLAGIEQAVGGAERVALSHLRDESRAIVADLFAGQRLEWRPSFVAQLGQQKFGTTGNTATLLRHADQASGGALRHAAAVGAPVVAGATGGALGMRAPIPGMGGGAGRAQELYDSLVPPDVAPEVARALASAMPDFMGELAASLTPFVGVIAAGAVATWNTKNALRAQWRLEWARHHVGGSLASADPAAALNALTRFLERERNQDIFSMSVSLGEFAGKLATALVDGGTASNTAIGASANLLKLMNIVRVVVRDVQEKNAANLAMRTRVDAGIFDLCPVVGAYLICCAPTSVMVNTIFEGRFGGPGWQDQVEIAVRQHLAPLKEQARRIVQEHRFYIPALANHQGMLEVNKDKLKAMLARKGKSGMVGFGPDNLPAELRA